MATIESLQIEFNTYKNSLALIIQSLYRLIRESNTKIAQLEQDKIDLQTELNQLNERLTNEMTNHLTQIHHIQPDNLPLFRQHHDE